MQQISRRAIVLGSLLCGTMDITAAIVFYALLRGKTATWLLQTVASGLLGEDAYTGNVATAALGLLCHFTIATGAAAVYYLASRNFNFLVQRFILFGAIYGIAVFWFMQLIVVPLSAFPHKSSYTIKSLITGLTIHIFCVGLPIAIANRLSLKPVKEPVL
jgi:hypothetical protein